MKVHDFKKKSSLALQKCTGIASYSQQVLVGYPPSNNTVIIFLCNQLAPLKSFISLTIKLHRKEFD